MPIIFHLRKLSGFKQNKKFTQLKTKFYWETLKLKYGYMVKKKVIQCPHCGKSSSEVVEEIEFKHAEKIGKILKSSKTSHEKKWHCLID